MGTFETGFLSDGTKQPTEKRTLRVDLTFASRTVGAVNRLGFSLILHSGPLGFAKRHRAATVGAALLALKGGNLVVEALELLSGLTLLVHGLTLF